MRKTQNNDAFEHTLEDMYMKGYLTKDEIEQLVRKYRFYASNPGYVNYPQYRNPAYPSNPVYPSNPAYPTTPTYPNGPTSPNNQAYPNTNNPVQSGYPAAQNPVPSRPPVPANYMQQPYQNYTPVQPKKLSKEQIKERNLSWILNIGVILLLISGLIFATTTWSLFNNVAKVSLLFCVSLFFFGVSTLAQKVLKIDKTATAFWMLGSLFLPVSLLSIGFFELAGGYYSIFGEGKYAYGAFCAFICLVVFVFSANKYKSRFFSWLSLGTLDLLFTFIVAGFYPPRLVLILFLIAFHAALLGMKQLKTKIGSNGVTKLLFRELGIFIPISLFITTVFTMASYSTELLYPIDLLLIAFLVLALSVTENHKAYDYLFFALFCIGIDLLGLSVHSYSLQLVILAFGGIVLTALAFLFQKDAAKQKRYGILSGIATGFAFFSIAILMLDWWEPLLVKYVGLACLSVLVLNYWLLYRRIKMRAIGALIPLQIFTIIYECLYILNQWSFSFQLEFVTVTTLLYFLLSYGVPYTKPIKEFTISSAICCMVNTLAIFIWCFIQNGVLISLPIIAAVFTVEVYVLWVKITDKDTKLVLNYCLACLCFATLCLIRYSYHLNLLPEYAFYFGCALVVFCLQFAAVGKLRALKDSFFYSGHVFLAATFGLLLLSKEMLLMKTGCILFMCLLYLYCFYSDRKRKIAYLWLNALLISVTALLFNFSGIVNVYANLDLTKYVFYANGFLLMLVFFYLKGNSFKQNLVAYLSLLTVILIFCNLFASNILWYEYFVELVFVALLCVVLSKMDVTPKIRSDWFLLIPLTLYVSATGIFLQYVLKSNLPSTIVVVAGAAILLTIGHFTSKVLFSKNHIDFYSLTALLSVFLLPGQFGIQISLPILAADFTVLVYLLWKQSTHKEVQQVLGYCLPFLIFAIICPIRFSYQINALPEYAFYFGCALVVFCLQLAAIGKWSSLKDSFYYSGHILLAATFGILLFSSEMLLIKISCILFLCFLYFYCFNTNRKNKIAYLWLNALLLTVTTLFFNFANLINVYENLDLTKYMLYANGFLLMLGFFYLKEKGFKQNLVAYLSLLTIISVFCNLFAGNLLWYEYCVEIAFAAILCVVMAKTDFGFEFFFDWISLIPLALYSSATGIFIQTVLKRNLASVAVVLVGAVILLIIGRRKNKYLFRKKHIDFYSLTALLTVFFLPYQYDNLIRAVGMIIPGVLGSLWFIFNRNRILHNDNRLGNLLFAVSILWPYYCFVSALNIPENFIYEVCSLPLVVLTYACIKWIYKSKHLQAVEYGVPIICYIIVLAHLITSDSILEAIVIGGFGVLSLLYGSLLKTKSALFTGGLLVIFSAIIKSRDFWLSIQWWVYLALIGCALVITASVNEYQKSKNSESLLPKVNKFLEKFRDWD